MNEVNAKDDAHGTGIRQPVGQRGRRTTLSGPRIDERLAQIESRVPKLMDDRDAFPRAFEDEVEILLGQVASEDQDYVLEKLDAIVSRSGFNA